MEEGVGDGGVKIIGEGVRCGCGAAPNTIRDEFGDGLLLKTRRALSTRLDKKRTSLKTGVV